jgi:uncharacterized protein
MNLWAGLMFCWLSWTISTAEAFLSTTTTSAHRLTVPSSTDGSSRYSRLQNMPSVLKGSYLCMKSQKSSAKKKKSSSSSSSSTASTSATASAASTPLRVTSNSNVSVRQQIAWARAYKRLLSGSKSSKSQTTRKFRNKGNAHEQSGPEDDTIVDYSNIRPPMIFIDGYNVIGYQHNRDRGNEQSAPGTGFNDKIDLEEARDSLVNDLSMLRGATGWDVELVFDAYNRLDGKSSFSVSEGIAVTYTSSTETADTYIERRFRELKEEGFKDLVVVTDDNLLRMVATSHEGCSFLPVASLLEELRIAYRGWERVEEELEFVAERQRPTIGDSISAEVRAALSKLSRPKGMFEDDDDNN